MNGSDQLFTAGDGTALRFFYEPVKNNFQSEKAGRAVFDTSLFVEVITPGSTESIPRFEVERVYCEEAGKDAQGNRLVERSAKYAQYQPQVEAFKSQSGEHLNEGTPLTQWPNIDVGTAATLRATGIQTVEQLAAVNDGHLANLGTGGRVLREQARAFLNARQFGIPTAQMGAEVANLRGTNEQLTAQVNDLSARLQAALAEVSLLRNGTPVQGSVLGSDAFGNLTPSQPNPGASLNAGDANALSPPDAKGFNENTEHHRQEGTPPPVDFGFGNAAPAAPQQPPPPII